MALESPLEGLERPWRSTKHAKEAFASTVAYKATFQRIVQRRNRNSKSEELTYLMKSWTSSLKNGMLETCPRRIFPPLSSRHRAEVCSSTMVSLPNFSIFSNISPSTVEKIKIQKNRSCSQSFRSSSASSIRNTVSSSVPFPRLSIMPMEP